jgi:hypothetical protein
MIPIVKSLRIDKLYYYSLTSDTGSHLVYQVMPASSSTSCPGMGDYKGWTGLSHHQPPTPQPWSTRQTKVDSSLDTMSMLSTTTLVS